MIDYNPPIIERDTDELIEIANSTNDTWQSDAIEQAKVELQKRNISIEFQADKLKQWRDESQQREIDYKNGLLDNFDKRYSKLEMIKIFFLAPWILSRRGFYDSDLSLTNLWKENFKTKFRQRFTLLIAGILFWIAFSISVFKYSEYLRMKEVEKIDISGWEKNRISNDKK